MDRNKLVRVGVDFNEGVRRFCGKREIYESKLREFLRDKHFRMLAEAVARGDCENAYRNAHALKGIAGNLSLTQLQADMLPLVEELRNGRMDLAAGMLDPIRNSYRQILEAIRAPEENRQ